MLINAFASPERMNLALGVERLDEVAERVQELLEFKSPASLADKIKMLPRAGRAGGFFPKTVKSAPCQEVVLEQDVDLAATCPSCSAGPTTAGRFITLPLVFTQDPDTGKRNCGMYRMQVYDERTTGMHWQLHKDGAQHYRTGYRAGRADGGGRGHRRRPGGHLRRHPARCRDDFDEMIFAGFLRGGPVEMVRCRTVGPRGARRRPRSSSRGTSTSASAAAKGPSATTPASTRWPTTTRSSTSRCITHRREPVYPTTIVGKPPMEDCYMGKAIERIFLPVMRKQFPEIVDMHMPFEGVFHNLMIVSIRKRYPGHARKVMHGIWGLGQAMFTKMHRRRGRRRQRPGPGRRPPGCALNNIDPQRDMEFVMGPVDSLDHASRLPGYGSKVGIDATRKWPEEGFTRAWPDEIEMSAEVKARVDALWPRLFK